MKWVLFFDGDCGFCSQSVRRVDRLDACGRIDFAPLQGKLARSLKLGGYAEKGGGSMVLLRESDGQTFIKGDALIQLGYLLGGVFAFLASAFSLFPAHARDWAYDLIARNRHRLSGGRSSCITPDDRLRKKMRE